MPSALVLTTPQSHSTKEANEMQARFLHRGLSTFAIDSHPDYIGIRVENSVQAEHRFEVKDSVRDALKRRTSALPAEYAVTLR